MGSHSVTCHPTHRLYPAVSKLQEQVTKTIKAVQENAQGSVEIDYTAG